MACNNGQKCQKTHRGLGFFVGSGVKQQTHTIQMTCRGGVMKRSSIITLREWAACRRRAFSTPKHASRKHSSKQRQQATKPSKNKQGHKACAEQEHKDNKHHIASDTSSKIAAQTRNRESASTVMQQHASIQSNATNKATDTRKHSSSKHSSTHRLQ